jgi:parallel beta-helix repeat protein
VPDPLFQRSHAERKQPKTNMKTKHQNKSCRNGLSFTKTLAICALTVLIAASTARALTVNVAAGASTATIQSAIDQVNAGGGGTVNLAAGGYTVTTPILMKSKVTLNGAGTPATTLGVNGNITIISAATEGLQNITIQNMKIVGTGRTVSTDCNGIIISAQTTHHSNVTISNVQVMNCGGMGILTKRADNTKVLNCNIHDNGGFTLMHNMYLRDETPITVTGCQLKNSPQGTGLHIAGVTANVSITGCSCTGNGSQGINVQDSPTGITIQNNDLSSNCVVNQGEGLGFTGTSALIDSNTANNNNGWGMYLFGGNGTLSNNTATGNTLGTYNIHGSPWTQINNH